MKFSLSLIIVFALSATFLIWRAIFVFPVFSDETIYINMARAVFSGLTPYKDFFYAHPPVQLYLLAPFSAFSFEVAKAYIAVIGFACAFLTYLIAKKLFGERAAILTFVAFLVYPGFLIFGSQAMGMFEVLLFLLLGVLFLLRKNMLVSSVFFALSFFTRYLAILIFPLILILFRKKLSRAEFRKFLVYNFIFFALSFFANYFLFGGNYLADTIFYHFQANITEKIGLANWVDQYLTLGFFTIFLSIFASVYGILYKDKTVILFSAYSIVYDLIILLALRQVIYHYFLLPLPFLFIAVGKVLSDSKHLSLKLFLITILAFALFTNLKSLEFYFVEQHNEVFYQLAEYTSENTNTTDTIFGEPRSSNYVSFATGRKIFGNYFDSDLKFINFAGRERILNEIGNSKPKLVFANQFYTEFFKDDYEVVREWDEPGYYDLILMRSKN